MGRLNQRIAIRSLNEGFSDFSHHVNKLWIEQGDKKDKKIERQVR